MAAIICKIRAAPPVKRELIKWTHSMELIILIELSRPRFSQMNHSKQSVGHASPRGSYIVINCRFSAVRRRTNFLPYNPTGKLEFSKLSRKSCNHVFYDHFCVCITIRKFSLFMRHHELFPLCATGKMNLSTVTGTVQNNSFMMNSMCNNAFCKS